MKFEEFFTNKVNFLQAIIVGCVKEKEKSKRFIAEKLPYVIRRKTA